MQIFGERESHSKYTTVTMRDKTESLKIKWWKERTGDQVFSPKTNNYPLTYNIMLAKSC